VQSVRGDSDETLPARTALRKQQEAAAAPALEPPLRKSA